MMKLFRRFSYINILLLWQTGSLKPFMKLIMIGKIFILITVLCVIIPGASGQGLKPGENPINKIWPAKFVSVDIISSADGSIQKAWYYRSESNDPQPLIVSLHTWTGDYNQEDPLTKEILLRDWNYIHPDFRGINNKPQACGSDLVIPDIYDAIIYAVKNGNVDTSNVHIIGVSGGGYATLLAFMPGHQYQTWLTGTERQKTGV
jgi:predicted alpha/beta-fold hydrolase